MQDKGDSPNPLSHPNTKHATSEDELPWRNWAVRGGLPIAYSSMILPGTRGEDDHLHYLAIATVYLLIIVAGRYPTHLNRPSYDAKSDIDAMASQVDAPEVPETTVTIPYRIGYPILRCSPLDRQRQVIRRRNRIVCNARLHHRSSVSSLDKPALLLIFSFSSPSNLSFTHPLPPTTIVSPSPVPSAVFNLSLCPS